MSSACLCNSQSPPAALHFSLNIILLTTNFLSSTVIDILSRFFSPRHLLQPPILHKQKLLTHSLFLSLWKIQNTNIFGDFYRFLETQITFFCFFYSFFVHLFFSSIFIDKSNICFFDYFLTPNVHEEGVMGCCPTSIHEKTWNANEGKQTNISFNK